MRPLAPPRRRQQRRMSGWGRQCPPPTTPQMRSSAFSPALLPAAAARAGKRGKAGHESPATPFGEFGKFLPVASVIATSAAYCLVFVTLHTQRMMQLDLPPGHRDGLKVCRGVVELFLFTVSLFMMLVSLARCCLSSPGTIPSDPMWDMPPAGGAAAETEGVPAAAVSATQEQKVDGGRRACRWCKKYKPDRCHHCRVCNTCVLRMDHHCPWVYNCIGHRNHKFFFLLLFYSIMTLVVFCTAVAGTLQAYWASDSELFSLLVLFISQAVACVLFVAVLGFSGFHVWMMLRAITTLEFCERNIARTGYTSKYDNGLWQNTILVFGSNPLLWLLPVQAEVPGEGVRFFRSMSLVSTPGAASAAASAAGRSSQLSQPHASAAPGGAGGRPAPLSSPAAAAPKALARPSVSSGVSWPPD